MLQFNYTVSRYSTNNAKLAYGIVQFNYTVSRYSATNAEPVYRILQFNHTVSRYSATNAEPVYRISGVSYTVNLRIAFANNDSVLSVFWTDQRSCLLMVVLSG